VKEPQKKILLIARNFPPMGGVGTRRWSKFSKYLAKKGYIVHVITIDYKYTDKVNWLHDVEHPNIIIHRIKSNYPKWILRHKKRSFIEKKIFEIVRLSYGATRNWLDNAQGWEKQLIPYASQLLKKHSIKNLIVTAAPCSVAYMTSIIKVENPEINLIVDFRDKWNDEPQYKYGSAIKSFKRKEKSVYMELLTMTVANKIIVTTNTIKQNFSSIYNHCSSKYITIHNGYDREDYTNTWKPQKKENNKLKLVYFGSLLGRQPEALDLIYEAIKKIDDPFFTDQFRIDVYGVASANYKNPNPKTCHFMPLTPSGNVAKILKDYHCGLSILDMERSNVFATKAFDYMAMKMPILHISNKGELYNLFRAKGQYTSNYDIDNMMKTLLTLKHDFINDSDFRTDDYKEFDISNLTNKVEELFV